MTFGEDDMEKVVKRKQKGVLPLFTIIHCKCGTLFRIFNERKSYKKENNIVETYLSFNVKRLILSKIHRIDIIAHQTILSILLY